MKIQLSFLIVLILVSCQKNDNKKDINEKPLTKSIEYLDFENLSSEAKVEFSKNYWLGSGKITHVSLENGGVLVGLTDDNDLYKNLIVTENYIVVSSSFGQNSQTIIYNKKQAKLIPQINSSMFVTGLLGQDVLSVQKDYYDSLDAQDPNYRGHIFENGKFDLRTSKYSFISNE